MPVPLITAGISVAGSLLGNRKSGAEKAMEGTAKQQSALATQIQAMAKNQHTMAGPALQKAMQHYMGLANGNTGAINSMLAPERGQLMETYRGAERGLSSRMAPGANRDTQMAELYRQRAGQMGMMPMMARQNAMGQLGNMGMTLNQGASDMMGMAGNVLSGATGTNAQIAQMQRQRQQGWQALGQNIGNIFMPWLQGKIGGSGLGGDVKLPWGKGVPSMPWTL